MAVIAWRTRDTIRRYALVAIPTLFAFGISDLVEASTGAWWRPWWLLAWKGLCVLILLILAVSYYRIKSKMVASRSKNNTSL